MLQSDDYPPTICWSGLVFTAMRTKDDSHMGNNSAVIYQKITNASSGVADHA